LEAFKCLITGYHGYQAERSSRLQALRVVVIYIETYGSFCFLYNTRTMIDSILLLSFAAARSFKNRHERTNARTQFFYLSRSTVHLLEGEFLMILTIGFYRLFYPT